MLILLSKQYLNIVNLFLKMSKNINMEINFEKK